MEEPEIDVRIRRIEQEDGPQIRQVLTAAFDSETEANLVAALTAENAIEYGLVAEAAGHHIGSIIFSRLTIVGGDEPIRALALGPVAVHPTRQGEGLGGQLIEASLNVPEAAAWDRVMLVGDAPYYKRFGFTRLDGVVMPPPTNPDRGLGRARRRIGKWPWEYCSPFSHHMGHGHRSGKALC